jgi:hypothetical protein
MMEKLAFAALTGIAALALSQAANARAERNPYVSSHECRIIAACEGEYDCTENAYSPRFRVDTTKEGYLIFETPQIRKVLKSGRYADAVAFLATAPAELHLDYVATSEMMVATEDMKRHEQFRVYRTHAKVSGQGFSLSATSSQVFCNVLETVNG